MAKNDYIQQFNEVCRISLGTELKGTLTSKSDIRVDGVFEGDLVTCGKLVIGDGAIVRGNVICIQADIWGKVEGDLIVGGDTTFKSCSSFEGSLKTYKICIEMGAIFKGGCEIISEADFKTISAEYFG